ncbi:MAG TPA: hypothetical protein VN580_10230 [Clostridia bacterium]|nr:hypothetical protein [Clostridia bacterium]
MWQRSPMLAIAMIIILISGLCAACAPTQEVQNTSSDKEAQVTEIAWELINRDIDNYESNPAVKITDSKITRLELIESFDKLADTPVHVYALEYRLLPEDLSKVVLAGGMDYDEEGWLKETCSMGSPLLVITQKAGKPEHIGTLWTGAVNGKAGLEAELQTLLERIASREKLTPIEEAILQYYGETSDPIFIYKQVPFEDGTLVLAEKLTDGEHYPDLHFVDAGNKVAYLTRGSYCWTLNYTQFRGRCIYFGLAGVETRQYNDNPVPVKKVEALFSDKSVSTIPEEAAAVLINPTDKGAEAFKNSQGYIMPVEGRDMPGDFVFTFENGESKSISKMHIERNIDNMPDYLKSKEAAVYNSFAFTFTPMLLPVEWDKGYKDGEICLEGKTDHNGNRNAVFLRPAGHMSLLDSFIIPQDIKALYLSDNYPRTADFSTGETVTVKYPEKRELLDCRILRLTRDKAEKDIGQDSFEAVNVGEKGRLILPEEKGHCLFLLRTVEDKEIQTYTGMFIVK